MCNKFQIDQYVELDVSEVRSVLYFCSAPHSYYCKALCNLSRQRSFCRLPPLEYEPLVDSSTSLYFGRFLPAISWLLSLHLLWDPPILLLIPIGHHLPSLLVHLVDHVLLCDQLTLIFVVSLTWVLWLPYSVFGFPNFVFVLWYRFPTWIFRFLGA